jgi:ElaB/YqjD/DUF883 family membrane-anchored ribosome-binding protein
MQCQGFSDIGYPPEDVLMEIILTQPETLMSKAPIAQQVEQDHRRLRMHETALEAEVNRMVSPTEFAQWRTRFLRQLRDFQYRLLQHFDLEEDGGFMADLVGHVPRMSDKIDALEAEHAELLDTLESIIADLKRADSLSQWENAKLKVRISSLLKALRKHEAAECALIQEAYYQDIGVAD